MDRHHARSCRENENGRDEKEYRRNLLRVERPNGKRQRRLLSHPGANGNHRIRAAAPGRRRDKAHPHDLPRSNERLRSKMVEAVTSALCRLPLLLALLAVPSAVFAHRDGQYLQATLVAIEPRSVRLQINLRHGEAGADPVTTSVERSPQVAN